MTCRRTHADDDPVLGKPLCGDCYDHPGQVVWNASASELWRRTTIAISRSLTRHARTHGGRVRVSFGKVAEYQRRGVVHYHALIRLDGLDPADPERVIPPPSWASVFVLAHTVTDAIGHTAVTTAPHPEQPKGWTIGWGDPDKAADVRPVRAAADHAITREAVAAYLARYATKCTETTGHVSARTTADTLPVYADETHPGRLIAAAWRLGADPEHHGLRRWAHALGYGGHFFTKSRRYTGTFAAERRRRITWRRNRAAATRLERAGAVDLVDQHTAETTDVPYRLVVLVLAYCGLRFGELAALRVRRVDLLRRRLEVAESVTEVAGRVTFGTAKTHQRRWVPLPRSLAAELGAELVGKGPDDLVFTSPEGGPLRVNNFRTRCFDRAAAEAGLGGLTPHELRHTAASLAVSAGANVKAVQRLLGHASASMTLDVYSGLFDDDLEAVADLLDAAATQARADQTRTEGLKGARRRTVGRAVQAD